MSLRLFFIDRLPRPDFENEPLFISEAKNGALRRALMFQLVEEVHRKNVALAEVLNIVGRDEKGR